MFCLGIVLMIRRLGLCMGALITMASAIREGTLVRCWLGATASWGVSAMSQNNMCRLAVRTGDMSTL